MLARVAALTSLGFGGFTPLLFASQQGEAASVDLLPGAGADVNVASPHGTGLHVAAVSGQVALVKTGLERGADPNANQPGCAAIHRVADSWEARLTRWSSVQVLSFQVAGGLPDGRIELLQALLDGGADPSVRIVNDGRATPGRHVRVAKGTPLTGLHLTMLDKLSLPMERFGDSTARSIGFPCCNRSADV